MREFLPWVTKMDRHREECDAAGKAAVGSRRVFGQHEGVTGVQPRLGNVDTLAALRQVGHDWPQIYQLSPERLVGTGPGFDPLQGYAGALRRVVNGLDRDPGGTAVRPDLDRWRVVLTH